MVKYFAYGSNMSAKRMYEERKINYTSRQFARLDNYRLVFNKKARNADYGYANIVASENSVVEGVLYEFPDNDIFKLDKVENYPDQYNRKEISVKDAHGNLVTAIVYIAQPDKVAEGLKPTKEYLDYLLAGRDILSDSYYRTLMEYRGSQL